MRPGTSPFGTTDEGTYMLVQDIMVGDCYGELWKVVAIKNDGARRTIVFKQDDDHYDVLSSDTLPGGMTCNLPGVTRPALQPAGGVVDYTTPEGYVIAFQQFVGASGGTYSAMKITNWFPDELVIEIEGTKITDAITQHYDVPVGEERTVD